MTNPYRQVYYRIKFETVDSSYVTRVVDQFGETYWPTLTDEQWDALLWYPVCTSERREDTGILDQHVKLKQWAASHEQPVRNVVLEKLVHEPEWVVVDDDG